MHVGTHCSWLDDGTDLNNVVGTIMINQEPCSYMIELNSDVTTTMNLVVVSSRVLHVLTYANNPCRFAKLHFSQLVPVGS